MIGRIFLKVISTIGAGIALLFIKMVLIRQDNKFCYRLVATLTQWVAKDIQP